MLNLQKSLLVLILAYLICHAARGLASGLAGRLALAASAVFNGCFDILGFNSLNSAHSITLRFHL